MRIRLSLMLLGLLAGLIGGLAIAADATAKRPNILLVLSDDQSVPHAGCYGNPDIKTPNIDRFASQGMRFDRAYVAAPQCVLSRAAMMTCRSTIGIRMTRFSAPLPAEVITYPELLRAGGYYTGVAGRTYHLDGTLSSPEAAAVIKKHNLKTFPHRLDFVKTAKRPEVLSQYREFLDSVPKGKPFFLQLCFFDPHRQWLKNVIPVPHDSAKLKLPANYPDTPTARDDFARYYDAISRFDGDFGQVLAELEKRGLAQDTVVAFMGDNGAALLRGKGTLYEFGINIPLVIRWPGVVRAGSAAKQIVSAEDLGPTFLAAAGVAPDKKMTGRSFLKLLRSEPFDGRKYVFAERGAHGSGLPTNSAFFDLGRCVVSQRYKLIYNALWQIPYEPVDFGGEPIWQELKAMNAAGKLSPLLARLYFSPTRPMFELFDLEKDPAEFNNLIGKKEAAPIEYELMTALQEWMILEQDYLPVPSPSPPAKKHRR